MIATALFNPNVRYRVDYMERVRSRMSAWIHGNVKCPSGFIPEFGCTIDELKIHIEFQFVDGMDWRLHYQWQIDHIVPCCFFNPTEQDEVFECNHWSNIRPLWPEDNCLGTFEAHNSRPFVDYERLKNVNPIDFWKKINKSRGQAGQCVTQTYPRAIYTGTEGVMRYLNT